MFAALVLAACNSSKPVNTTGDRDDNGEIKEHRDQWHPNEAQSDFLDIGKQAGIEWLSFVPQDQQEYPEYFTGLDRDQKRRVRLAPKESDERVLLEFNLPEGSKLWPVSWFGKELMAVDLPGAGGYSIALASGKFAGLDTPAALAKARASSMAGAKSATADDGFSIVTLDNEVIAMYGQNAIAGRTGAWVVIVEVYSESKPLSLRQQGGVGTLLNAISIKRELALEGSPKHKCSSTLEEQLAGTLRFPDGLLKLPVQDGHLVRKIGGDSTIQIDGEDAEPWILIRRMKAPDDDIRAVVRKESAFKRRRETPSAKFGQGFTPEGAKLPLVVCEYGDSGAENELVGVLKAGGEWFVFEVVSTGLRGGDQRRAAKVAALTLLAGATADGKSVAPEFEKLIGWNASE